MVVRWIEVNHQADVVDVQPAGGHIGGHQHPRVPGGEPVEGALALVLVEVTVDRGGLDSGPGQLLGQPGRAVLGPGEDQGAVGPPGDLGRDRHLVRGGQDEHLVIRGLARLIHRGDGMQGRVGQVPGDQAVHVPVQRGGEQHPLPVRRCRVEQLGHGGQEAQVGHVICLVHDGDLDLGQAGRAAVDQVDEPAGRGDHDVHPAGELVDLPAHRGTAVDGGDPDAEPAAQRGEHLGDLAGQFPGGDQDKPAGRAGLAAAGLAGQPGQQRKAEGEGLAGPGLRAAQHVPARQRVGQGPGLDGEGCVDALLGERGDQGSGQAQLGKGRRGRSRGAQRGGQGALELRHDGCAGRGGPLRAALVRRPARAGRPAGSVRPPPPMTGRRAGSRGSRALGHGELHP